MMKILKTSRNLLFTELKTKSSGEGSEAGERLEVREGGDTTAPSASSASWSKHCMSGITLCFKVE